MNPDSPSEIRAACVAFLQAHGAPTSKQLLHRLAMWVIKAIERYGDEGVEGKPAEMSVTAWWLQHVPEQSPMMRDIVTAAERKRSRRRSEPCPRAAKPRSRSRGL